MRVNWRAVATHFLCTLFGGAIGCAVSLHVAEATIQKNTAACLQAMENRTVMVNSQAATIKEMKAQLDETFSEVTVLYDRVQYPAAQIPLLHGAVQLSVSIPDANNGANVQWVIPAKIRPQVVGAHGFKAYSYWNLSTNKVEGPFYPVTENEPPRN